MGFRPWGLFRALARIGTPVLRILGVKRGTAADKAAEVARTIEPLLPPDEKSTK